MKTILVPITISHGRITVNRETGISPVSSTHIYIYIDDDNDGVDNDAEGLGKWIKND